LFLKGVCGSWRGAVGLLLAGFLAPARSWDSFDGAHGHRRFALELAMGAVAGRFLIQPPLVFFFYL